MRPHLDFRDQLPFSFLSLLRPVARVQDVKMPPKGSRKVCGKAYGEADCE